VAASTSRWWAGAIGFAAGALIVVATAVAAAPDAPTIIEPAEEGQLVHPADVHMEATGFDDADGDTHSCTDWEIWTVAAPEKVWEAPCATSTDATHIHLGDGSFVGAYAGRDELEYDTGYTLRVRFRDSAGEVSAWAERAFGTYPPAPPGGEVAWTPLQPEFVVEEVACGFQLPLNIAFVPNPGPAANDPLLYLSELYGDIKVVTRDGGVGDYAADLLNFDPTGDFPGSGEQGLTGLFVEPVTGDVLASLLYDANPPGGPHYPKVVRFHSTDGGNTAASETTVLDMAGETQGASHQVSNLSIGPDGKLYVHMGDGFTIATAQNLDSFRGKILRLNLDGSPPTDNPFYDASNGINARDYVFAYGFRNPFGGDWRAANGAHYEVENGPKRDRLARVVGGQNYGWDGTDASMGNHALYAWDPSHAPVNIAFVESETFAGSRFPSAHWDHAFVTESGPTYATGPQTLGKRIVEFEPDATTGELGGHPRGFVEYTGIGKATAAGLAAGPDGLYFTELYKDLDYNDPTNPGARLLRVRDSSSPPDPLLPPAVDCPSIPAPDDPTPPPSAPVPPNDFEFGKVKRHERKGTATLTVEVPGPGELGLSGKGVVEIGGPVVEARASRLVDGGAEKLAVKPRRNGAAARQILRRLRDRGKATVRVLVTYLPTGGSPNTLARAVKLVLE
jgi:glucose/arabinose dehydrogenase